MNSKIDRVIEEKYNQEPTISMGGGTILPRLGGVSRFGTKRSTMTG